MKVPRSAGAIGIRVGEDGGRAGFSGLCSCGSVHACPVHAAKIGAERAREEIAPVIRYVVDNLGGSVVHVTLTVQHRAGLPLAETRRAVQGAWEHVGNSRRWRALDKEFARSGWCKAFEATHGTANGWHPHLHVLLFLEDQISAEDCDRLGDELFTVYRAGLEKHGYDCTALRGVRAELATTRRDADVVLGRYLTKIASEITRNDRKTAHGDRYTPFDLLREAIEQGNADALGLWHEWEQATAGTKQLTWSGKWRAGPDIRTRAGLRCERTDQEIADDEIGDPVMIEIENAEWTRRGVWRMRTDLLDAGEAGGAVGVAALLTVRGIGWSSPHPDVNAPGWRQDLAVMTELYRRSARMTLPGATAGSGRFRADDWPGPVHGPTRPPARADDPPARPGPWTYTATRWISPAEPESADRAADHDLVPEPRVRRGFGLDGRLRLPDAHPYGPGLFDADGRVKPLEVERGSLQAPDF